MASKVHTGDEAEMAVKNTDSDGAFWPEELDGPVVFVRFRWDEPEGHDSYKLRCPFCDGDVHFHDTLRHPRVTLGGISPAQCRVSRERYYLILAQNGRGPTCEVVRKARKELVDFSGGEIEPPLIPKGMDPRVVNDVVNY